MTTAAAAQITLTNVRSSKMLNSRAVLTVGEVKARASERAGRSFCIRTIVSIRTLSPLPRYLRAAIAPPSAQPMRHPECLYVQFATTSSQQHPGNSRARTCTPTPTHVEPISNNGRHSRPSEQNTTPAVGTPLISIVKSSVCIIRCQHRAAGGAWMKTLFEGPVSLYYSLGVLPVVLHRRYRSVARLFATLQIALQQIADCHHGRTQGRQYFRGAIAAPSKMPKIHF